MSRGELIGALSYAGMLAPKNRGRLDLRAQGGELRIQVVGHVGFSRATLKVLGDHEFNISVACDRLVEVVHALPQNEVWMQHADGFLRVTCGPAVYKLMSQTTGDESTRGIQRKGPQAQVPANVLVELLKRVKHAMSTSADAKPLASCVHLEKREGLGVVEAVATDGFCMAHHEVECAEWPFNQMNIGRDEVKLILRFLSGLEGLAIDVWSDGTTIGLSREGHETAIFLEDTTYYAWRRALPSIMKRTVTCDRMELHEALKRAAVLADAEDGVMLKLDVDTLAIEAEDREGQVSHEKIDVDLEGDGLAVAFDLKPLLEILLVLDGEQVRMKFGDEYDACLVYAPGDCEGTYGVVVPLKDE